MARYTFTVKSISTIDDVLTSLYLLNHTTLYLLNYTLKEGRPALIDRDY